MQELTFIDMSGVHVIVDASIRAREAGRCIVLARPCPSVERVFALTGSFDHVEIGEIDALGTLVRGREPVRG